MARLFKSYFQSDFGGEHKAFEAAVLEGLEGRDLLHWWRNNSAPGNPWTRGEPIIENQAAFPGSMIQSDFKSADHGNFEVVVPVFSEAESVELRHYWRDNSNYKWSFGGRITEPGRRVVGPASIIQSDFTTGGHGNLEVVVPVVGDTGRAELWHYWRDNSNNSWLKEGQINDPTHEVLGGGCIIQSNFGNGKHGNFEVAAWVRLPDGRSVLQHYWYDNSGANSEWQPGSEVIAGAKGNGVMIQSSFGSPHGNFEVVVPVNGPGGTTYLQHLWRDNSDTKLTWHFGQVITEVASAEASAAIFESDYRIGVDHGNFEVLVDECRQSLVDYWLPNYPDETFNLPWPWIRHKVLISEPPNREIRNTTRICQLTGEFDRTGWDSKEQPPFAFNKTESRYGIRGTDLGVSFEHKNRAYFLFGDTWRLGETSEDHFCRDLNWDSIAFCTDTSVQGGLSLTFYKQPPMVPGIGQGGFDVPLDGFSFQGLMFCFFSTDHRHVGDDADLMGRSVLAVSENDGYDFVPLLNFSRNKFINVSVERAQLDLTQSNAVGWPVGTEVLWVWGSGRYRGSPAYLAVVDLESLVRLIWSQDDPGPIELREINEETGPVLFFVGTDTVPLPGGSPGQESPVQEVVEVLWSSNELDALQLFCAGDIGELSGRRNGVFNLYFLTYNTGNPRGITLRYAPQPWGPWSEGRTIFDPGWGRGPNWRPIGAGYGSFMHVPWNVAQVDNVQDDAFLLGRRDNEWGGEYGPYQITRYSGGEANQTCDLYYTMSTWNPYQSMLMRTRIQSWDLSSPRRPPLLPTT